MADSSSIEISIGTGEKPEKPGASISSRIEIGGSEVDDLKSDFEGIMGSAPEDLTVYIVINCKCIDSATELAEKLSNIWQTATNKPRWDP